LKLPRYYAVADIPRDAFMQHAVAWLTPKTHLSTCFTMLNLVTSKLVVLHQRVYTQIEKNSKIRERWGSAPLGYDVANPYK